MSFKIVLFIILLCVTKCLQKPLLLSRMFKETTNKINSFINSNQVAYINEQTVAIVDINEKNEMRKCEIIEIYEPSEAKNVLNKLPPSVQQKEITFSEMLTLMNHCENLDKFNLFNENSSPKGVFERATIYSSYAFNLLFGIIPGTKWCGTGDIAKSYHDLGLNTKIDRCCRNHDLCPVKVRAQRIRYNITNNAFYTKSHCDCDKILYQCLKSTNTVTSNILGVVFFNILQVDCIEDKKISRPKLIY